LILREGYDYDFSRADPATGAHVDPSWCALYETATFADEQGRLGPMLAMSWREDEDGLAWRFRIREGAVFHSGRPCDARAVAEAFSLHADAEASPINAFFWKPVRDVGAEDGEVVVRLHYPCAGLPTLLRSWHAAVHNQEARERLGDAYGREGNIDGTGPFRFRAWKPGELFEVERVDGRARLDGVRWVPLLSESDRAAALDAGEVDCVQNVSFRDRVRLESNPELRVIAFQQSALVYLALDHETAPFGDERVRRAISHALDRDLLAAEIGTPQYGPIPSASPRAEPGVERFNAYDPRLARELLDKAVVRDLRFRARVLEDSVVRHVAELVRAQLHEVGVELELDHVAGFEAFYGSLGEHPEAFVSKWFWPDPVDAIVGFVASWQHDGPNWQRASDPEIDQACLDWQQAPDAAAQDEASARLQLLCAERLPLVPLVAPTAIWAHHERVRGWHPTPTNLYPLYGDVRIG
jgi:peptide/nickel transport system substrate-binding protein